MVGKSFVWAGISDFRCPVVFNPWVFFDVDNGKAPITIAILGNKRFA
jgi:hypothetical protein